MGQLEAEQTKMEDEGLYVPFPTAVSSFNLKRLAKRRHADRKVG